jgi:hypothetical protein
MVVTVKHNIFITVAYFRSGFTDENGCWKCLRQAIYHQFLVLHLEEVE